MVVENSVPLVSLTHQEADLNGKSPGVRFQLHPKSTHLQIWNLKSAGQQMKPKFLNRSRNHITGPEIEFNPPSLLYHDNNSFQKISYMLSELTINSNSLNKIIKKIISVARLVLREGSSEAAGVIVVEIELTTLYSLQENELIGEYQQEVPSCAHGYGMVPADWKSIAALEIVKLNGKYMKESCICSICLEVLPVGSNATRMPCFHLFHETCIIKWLKSSHYCPTCRFELNT